MARENSQSVDKEVTLIDINNIIVEFHDPFNVKGCNSRCEQ